MSPTEGIRDYLGDCFPRVSGDEPHANHVAVYLGGFSPRERG